MKPLSISEMARIFEVHPNTIRRWIEWGRLPAVIYAHEIAAHVERLRRSVPISEAAKRLGLSRQRIYEYVADGRLEVAFEDRGKIVVTSESLDRLIRDRADREEASQ